MRYQVPQFIEVEDRLFGPLTLKQFLYVAGGAAAGFIIWSIIPIKIIAVIIALPVVAFFLALAFYKYNGRPFVVTVENSVKYFLGDKLYIWKKEDKKIDPNQTPGTDVFSTGLGIGVPKLSDSNLKKISFELDINENLEE